jgi:hypothetical protein
LAAEIKIFQIYAELFKKKKNEELALNIYEKLHD